VVGVGQSDIDDVIGGEAVGAHVSLSAPGVNSVSTSKAPNKYVFSFGGSSAASPVVSGVIAIVRGSNSELTGRQAAEITRLSGDNIDNVNPSVAGIAARRVNMLKAVTRVPFSSPAIRPKDIKYFVRNNIVTRFTVGDTVTAVIKGFNYLGSSLDVLCSLEVPDLFPFFKLIDSTALIPIVKANESIDIPHFKFVVSNETTERKFIRVNMKSSNYDDYFLLPIIPTVDIATFENDSLRFSLGDLGSFGYSRNGVDWAGVGLDYKNGGNVIFSTSPGTDTPDHVLILTEDTSKLVTSNVNGSFFTSEKNFVEPQPNKSIINDSTLSESDRIGVKIEREVTMITGLPAAKIRFTITNVSGKTLKNIALGYYLDWDIGELGSYNFARSFNEAIPQGLSNSAAEMISREGSVNIGTEMKPYPVAGWLVSSNHPTALPQMAAVSVAEFLPVDFGSEKKIQLLNSGTSLQTTKKTDLGMAAGMKFSGDFPANETRIFDLYIGAALSEAELASTLKSSVLFNSIKNEYQLVSRSDWSVTPNPANDEIIITGNESVSSHITLYSMIGEIITKMQIMGNMAHISTAQLPEGVYAVHIQTGEKHSQHTVIIVH
ncbi:MAG: T9SS type A sorting domain-containing protein, partial [Ignavibacteriae bacterium]|nr:T9SS type A sorting domain-containing protein [Ignavibacteriota bacterium]